MNPYKMFALMGLLLSLGLMAACSSPTPTTLPTATVVQVQPTAAPTQPPATAIAPTTAAPTATIVHVQPTVVPPQQPTPTITEGALRLTNTDTGKKVDLVMGGILEIAFETSTTEGYTWQVMEIDSAVVKQMGDPVFIRQSNNMGNPGMQVWKFQAVGAGSTLLKLGYAQWFNKTVPNPTFEATVSVK